MKVLFLTTSFPVSSSDASGVFVKRLVNALSKYIDIHVITPAHNGNSDSDPVVTSVRYFFRKYQIICHQPGGLPVAIKENPILTFMLLPLMVFSLFLTTLHKARGYDVLCGNWSLSGVICALIGKILRKPSVVILRGADANSINAKGGSLISRLTRTAIDMCDCTIMVSDNLGSQIENKSKNIFVINNGITTSNGLKDESYWKSDKVLRIISIGHLIQRKDYPTQIEAARELSREGVQFEWVVVGDGPEVDHLKGLVNRRGLSDKFRFVGLLGHERALQVLASSDVFVMSSLSEGRSNALVEAFASGLPVVVSDIPATRELVLQSNGGYLFPVGDYSMLSERLLSLMNNVEERDRMGASGRKWVVDQNLTWESCAQQYLSVFQSMVG